jgi:hypothetical protein
MSCQDTSNDAESCVMPNQNCQHSNASEQKPETANLQAMSDVGGTGLEPVTPLLLRPGRSVAGQRYSHPLDQNGNIVRAVLRVHHH